MIQPKQLVSMIIANNPGAVLNNMMALGGVDSNAQLTPDSFIQYLHSLPVNPINPRQDSIEKIVRLLNVPVHNNMPMAAELTNLMTSNRQRLVDIVYTTFDAAMPKTVEQANTNVSEQSLGNSFITPNILENDMFVDRMTKLFALIGFVFVVVIFIKLIGRLFDTKIV